MAYVVTKWLKMAQISKMVIFQDFSKIPNTCVLSSFYTKFAGPLQDHSHYNTKNVVLRILGNLDNLRWPKLGLNGVLVNLPSHDMQKLRSGCKNYVVT